MSLFLHCSVSFRGPSQGLQSVLAFDGHNTKRINTLCGLHAEGLNVKQVVVISHADSNQYALTSCRIRPLSLSLSRCPSGFVTDTIEVWDSN